MSEGATVEKKSRGPARALPALTAKTAASAKGDPAGRYELRDAGKDHVRGLGLVVQPSGSKAWVLRYEAAGVPRKLTLEPYSDEFGLAAARKLASRFRIKIAEGADPAAEKAEARRKAAAGIDQGAMFSSAWTDWTNAPKPKSRSKKGWRPSTALRAKQDYERRLEPVWGKRRLDFKRRNADAATLEFDGEILVRDLEECPRRLKLARFIDRFEGGMVYYQGPLSPTWISPPRAGR
ncbi:Arm DNA-binding domain-containing protein [Bradyrhizobium sp. MOS003]|uniref:Arm DNA-binding domain-containing protein n=1 Tax=Bradyrhizobium sp. MOS003 TaxID=2133946 RepID=UPI000D13166A|nr:Arm DNA-binding domain-containing protein [Bradyrhizobium sp. MOS003]PSO20299.1 hypothetical protein C7G42_00810 [Bradyrhizobium sp. MOS003]